MGMIRSPIEQTRWRVAGRPTATQDGYPLPRLCKLNCSLFGGKGTTYCHCVQLVKTPTDHSAEIYMHARSSSTMTVSAIIGLFIIVLLQYSSQSSKPLLWLVLRLANRPADSLGVAGSRALAATVGMHTQLLSFFSKNKNVHSTSWE
jgi:hypothetical protein